MQLKPIHTSNGLEGCEAVHISAQLLASKNFARSRFCLVGMALNGLLQRKHRRWFVGTQSWP